MAVTTKSQRTRPRSARSGSISPKKRSPTFAERIEATRWPEKETVEDASQGVQLQTMQELARYWVNGYDFGRVEARLNALPQFVTEYRRSQHPLHPRQVSPRRSLAADHHPRLARISHRDAQPRRSTH